MDTNQEQINLKATAAKTVVQTATVVGVVLGAILLLLALGALFFYVASPA